MERGREEGVILKIRMKRNLAGSSSAAPTRGGHSYIINTSLATPSARSRLFYGAPPLFNSAQRMNYLEAITSPPRSLAYYRRERAPGQLDQSISIKKLQVEARGAEMVLARQAPRSMGRLESAACSPMSGGVMEQSRQKKLHKSRSTFHHDRRAKNKSSSHRLIILPKAETPDLKKTHALMEEENNFADHQNNNGSLEQPSRVMDSTEFMPGQIAFGATHHSIYSTTSMATGSNHPRNIRGVTTPSRGPSPTAKMPNFLID